MDFSSVQGKVVIVTGASRGIGRAIAECYGAQGMKVVCAARSAEQGEAVANGIREKGGDAKAVVEKFLPGFAANEQAKAAYGMTFGKIGPTLGLPDEALQGLLSALDTLQEGDSL